MELSFIFAENLRAARQALGLTQKELGARIGYSEKAISKWECGGAIPPAAELLRLSEVLHMSLDALLSGGGEAKYFLGIDGGGTKTAFLLQRADGTEVATCRLGPSNPNDIGMDACQALLEKGIAEVTAGLDRREIAVFAGIAGGGLSGNNADAIAAFLSRLGFAYAENGSDVENALEAALHGEDGVAVIAGTGSIAFAQERGERYRVGGWGYLLDGGGCGYDVARDALSACFRAVDGRDGQTLLVSRMEKALGMSLPDAIPQIYSGGKRMIASLAPVVFEAAREGDSMALAIVEKNARHIAELIVTAHGKLQNKAAPAVIIGGLANHEDLLGGVIRALVPAEIELKFDTSEMIKGAVARAERGYYEQHRKA